MEWTNRYIGGLNGWIGHYVSRWTDGQTDRQMGGIYRKVYKCIEWMDSSGRSTDRKNLDWQNFVLNTVVVGKQSGYDAAR